MASDEEGLSRNADTPNQACQRYPVAMLHSLFLGNGSRVINQCLRSCDTTVNLFIQEQRGLASTRQINKLRQVRVRLHGGHNNGLVAIRERRRCRKEGGWGARGCGEA
eukprot:282287-Pleurochrysis_carterae.AAC.1